MASPGPGNGKAPMGWLSSMVCAGSLLSAPSPLITYTLPLKIVRWFLGRDGVTGSVRRLGIWGWGGRGGVSGLLFSELDTGCTWTSLGRPAVTWSHAWVTDRHWDAAGLFEHWFTAGIKTHNITVKSWDFNVEWVF